MAKVKYNCHGRPPLFDLIILLLFYIILLFVFYRQIPALTSLQTLHMRNTQRTLSNFPAGLESLDQLTGNSSYHGQDESKLGICRFVG